jgi:hypothetical protein
LAEARNSASHSTDNIRQRVADDTPDKRRSENASTGDRISCAEASRRRQHAEQLKHLSAIELLLFPLSLAKIELLLLYGLRPAKRRC